MNAKKIFLLVFFIGISGLVYYFTNSNSASSLPFPKFVSLDEQNIVSFYDWALIGPSGVSKNMIADEKNVILIHMWDVNDPNVVEELETLQTIYDEYKTKAQFYFVTKNTQIEVRNFIEQHQFTFPVYFSLSRIPKPMEFTFPSSTYLLSKKGRIVVESKVATNWDDDALRLVLNNLVK
ncbi:hypothetical protein GFJ94_11185 [Flavobacterium sp. LMO8]|uniref:peroxiredoxin family protein n=1 Tax=Flavobacterium sp. LMO8 TaxID=2654244 RepID=UPI001291C7C5|nr:hypothetical protein [Flavobacterium sp. LMO8]MQP25625.1 hypothetical protein [Flavobacterium sp. LMO8]